MRVLLDGTQNVQLDASGNGSVRLAFPGKYVIINRLTVATSPATRETECSVYANFIGPPYLVDVTRTGGTGDTSDTTHIVPDGSCLYVVWSNGDAGATATVTYSGTEQ